jgi:hypothetical protein
MIFELVLRTIMKRYVRYMHIYRGAPLKEYNPGVLVHPLIKYRKVLDDELYRNEWGCYSDLTSRHCKTDFQERWTASRLGSHSLYYATKTHAYQEFHHIFAESPRRGYTCSDHDPIPISMTPQTCLAQPSSSETSTARHFSRRAGPTPQPRRQTPAKPAPINNRRQPKASQHYSGSPTRKAIGSAAIRPAQPHKTSTQRSPVPRRHFLLAQRKTVGGFAD